MGKAVGNARAVSTGLSTRPVGLAPVRRTRPQFHRRLPHPKPATQTLAQILATTGCRVSEALAIRACDVGLEANEVRIATLKRQQGHWRGVPVPKELATPST